MLFVDTLDITALGLRRLEQGGAPGVDPVREVLHLTVQTRFVPIFAALFGMSIWFVLSGARSRARWPWPVLVLVLVLVRRLLALSAAGMLLALDVTRRADSQQLVDTAVDRFGRLDVLVVDAGSLAVSPFDDLRVDDWDAVSATNVGSVLNGIAAALPGVPSAAVGAVRRCRLDGGASVKSSQAVCAATKTAVKVLTEALRQESGPDLRVTLVSPGFTDTEGIGEGMDDDAGAAMRQQRDESAMPPTAVAGATGFAISRPAGVDISEIVVRPTIQD